MFFQKYRQSFLSIFTGVTAGFVTDFFNISENYETANIDVFKLGLASIALEVNLTAFYNTTGRVNGCISAKLTSGYYEHNTYSYICILQKQMTLTLACPHCHLL